MLCIAAAEASAATVRKSAHGVVVAIGAWALIYVAALVIGLSFLPGVAAFWIPAALVSALPGLWFGIAGWR